MKFRWIFLLTVSLLGVYAYSTAEELPKGHETPYIATGQSEPPASDASLLQRIILFGDAGESRLSPLQPSLQMALDLASQSPAKTTVLALGDNIYYRGYPVLEEGEQSYDEDQLEDISHLNAQLMVAKGSGAQLVMLPGNHDWYAGQTDDQARHIADFAAQHKVAVSLRPWQENGDPLPEILHLNGVSILFVDSQWVIQDPDAHLASASATIEKLLATVPAGNVLVMGAHHPIETMGPHARFYTSRAYKLIIAAMGLIWENDQDVDTPKYKRYIEAVNRLLAAYNRPAIYVAGHDHNLQLFGGKQQPSPQYRIVSGAANTSKVTGVGDNENTLFAVSREGFMALELHQEGLWLRVWTIEDSAPVLSTRLF